MRRVSAYAIGDVRLRKRSDANIAHTPAAKITTSVQLHHRTRTLPVHATYACTSERELLRSESEGMYALIGAGPMGLAAARNLSKHGVAFVGFELHADVGGLWDIENPHSTMYESAHLISSKTMTEFKEFPMDARTAHYPGHSAMRAYFRAYAKHFDLYPWFRFHHRVERTQRADKGWDVTFTHQGKTQTERFRGLIIANGTLHHPHIPSFQGQFDGELIHASAYRSADILRDRRVLIVGCGNSGADIAVEAVHHAARVDLSMRRGYYFLPKFIGGKPIDTLGGKLQLPRAIKQRVDAQLIRAVVGKPSDYGFPDPDYPMYASHPVMNTLVLHHAGQGDITPRPDVSRFEGNSVHFVDGAAQDYDLIILATGYKLHYPFIDRSELNWKQHSGAPELYLNTFHPKADDLFILGMIEATGLGWEGRNEQAELLALYLRNLEENTQAAQEFQQRKSQRAQERIDGGYRYLKLDRMAYYVHKESFLKEIRTETRRLRGGIDELSHRSSR